ncbi:MAG: DUF692 domain-containing protein [Acidobacteriia bacterium]|nr:DUF692 domain-containing protein [Terriglobia bacterium]
MFEGATSGGGIPHLGIGLPYFATLPAEIYRCGLIDFVEITPETICRQRAAGDAIALEIVPDQMERALHTCAGLPLVVHGVELSIGSAHGWNEAYLHMLDAFQAAWPFTWHSEHLGFQTIPGDDGKTLEVGVPLPLPPTIEAADLVSRRSVAIRQRYGVPFLLENPAYYLPDAPGDPEIGDDIGLMRKIIQTSGCLQLLDLHNVYCNAVNHDFDPFAAIDRMPLDAVAEIHIAGGSWDDGFRMDAHDGRVPEPVWDLLEYTLPQCPSVGGVVFELLDEHAVRLGVDAIQKELMRAREIWNRRGRGDGDGATRVSDLARPVGACL